MPIAPINGAKIFYKILGDSGPWVAAIQGARHSFRQMRGFTRAIASRGYRVIVHDPRNCGRSSLDFNTLGSEDDVRVDDLHALLRYLDVERAFVVGQSRGARIAIRFALSHPDKTHGLGLWGFGGGAAAVKFLDDYYFGQWLRACEEGGMEAVCALGHFARLIAKRPANRDELLSMDPLYFKSAISRWRSQWLPKINQPVMGLCDEELRTVSVPTAIVPLYDWAHPFASATHAHKMIPGSRLFDFDPTRHDSHLMETDDDTVAAILCKFEASLSPGRATGFRYNLWHPIFWLTTLSRGFAIVKRRSAGGRSRRKVRGRGRRHVQGLARRDGTPPVTGRSIV